MNIKKNKLLWVIKTFIMKKKCNYFKFNLKENNIFNALINKIKMWNKKANNLMKVRVVY